MKKKEDLEKSESELNPSDIASLEWVIQNLTKFIEENKVDKTGMTTLQNLCTIVINTTHNYSVRVVNLLKQDHMLD